MVLPLRRRGAQRTAVTGVPAAGAHGGRLTPRERRDDAGGQAVLRDSGYAPHQAAPVQRVATDPQRAQQEQPLGRAQHAAGDRGTAELV